MTVRRDSQGKTVKERQSKKDSQGKTVKERQSRNDSQGMTVRSDRGETMIKGNSQGNTVKEEMDNVGWTGAHPIETVQESDVHNTCI